MNKKCQLLIVDDQRIFAEGLKYVIESRTDEFEVFDIVENGKEALKKLQSVVPEIILMDVRMPVMDGVEATKRIHELYPQVKILVLSTFDDDEYVKQSVKYGAAGYLLKNRPPSELIDSIRALKRGIIQIDAAVMENLFNTSYNSKVNNEMMKLLSTLTTRERQILHSLVKAQKISFIAKEFCIAEQTVRNHISNIYFKLGIHNRIEIVKYINDIRSFLDA